MVEQRDEQPRVQLKGALAAAQRFGRPLELVVRRGEVGQSVWLIRIGLQRSLQLRDPVGDVPGLERDQAEQIARTRMLRVAAQRMVTGSTGGTDASGGMVGQRLCSQAIRAVRSRHRGPTLN